MRYRDKVVMRGEVDRRKMEVYRLDLFILIIDNMVNKNYYYYLFIQCHMIPELLLIRFPINRFSIVLGNKLNTVCSPLKKNSGG